MKDTTLFIREARADDLMTIVALYADDILGKAREISATEAPAQGYQAAFEAISADENHVLAVGEIGGEVVATLLLSFLPGLSQGGAWRGQIEAMRVASDRRGEGLGRQILDWAVEQSKARGCRMVQLTSDRQRADAHRFYEAAGFVRSHAGFKLRL